MTATTGTLRPRAGGSGARPRHSPWACSASSRRAGRPACFKWPLLSAAARPPGLLLGRGHRVLRCSRALHEERPRRSPCPCGGLWRHRAAGPRLSVGTLNTQAADGYHSGLGQDERGRRLRPKLDQACTAYRAGGAVAAAAARTGQARGELSGRPGELLTCLLPTLLVPAAAAHARRVSAARLVTNFGWMPCLSVSEKVTQATLSRRLRQSLTIVKIVNTAKRYLCFVGPHTNTQES